MTREKMMELWRNEFENSYYQWGMTPQTYDYLEEKTDELVGSIITKQKYYASYEDWIVRELDGENHELARRMLVVISKIRNNGLISSSYQIKNDVDVCLRIGYDFASIVKESVNKFRDINASSVFWLAEKLLECYPADAEAFAERLFSVEKLEEMIEKRKSTRDIYLALAFSVLLLKKDAKVYGRYLPVLEDTIGRLGGDHIITTLYYSYELSPKLKDELLKIISSNADASRTLCLLTSAKNYIPFLQKISAPLWPYYYLVMNDAIKDVNKPKVIRALYKEDKSTFMELYGVLSSSNNPRVFILAPYLLSVMLNNGEGQAELENSGVILSGALKCIFNEYADKQEFNLSNVADESTPLSELNEKVSFSRGFGWGVAEEAIGAFSVLFDYSSRARRLVGYFLQEKNKGMNYRNNDNVSYTAAYFLKSRKVWIDSSPEDGLQLLLQSEGDYSLLDAFKTYCFVQISAGSLQEIISAAITPGLIMDNKEVALELLNSGQLNVEESLVWLNLIYRDYKNTDYAPLIDLLSNKSKLIRKKIEELIIDKEDAVRALLEQAMPKMKADALIVAKRTIKRWDNERKFGANFELTDNKMVVEFCTDNYEKDYSKFFSWIPEDMCTGVRFADLAENAPAIVVQYILSEYLSQEEAYKIPLCDKVVERLHLPDFQAAMENMYRLWMDNGAEAKKKMIMVPYCIYASDSQILRFKTQLKDWAEASRGAIAAFVVNAIAMNGGSVALMMLDGISVKFPNNQVKNAAKSAFAFAAKALGIPEDELSDKIVPTLGFSKEGEKVLDYGSRTFTVTLMPDFTLSITDDEKRKTIKSMPSPGANDDTVKATAAKKEFSELKKQIKATVQSQTNRLEKVLMNGRCWKISAWNTLFVENPIMHRFATGLIWGVYKDGELSDTFRYMDDGTFNTVDEEEYTLPEDAGISLVHPVELSADCLAQWKEQLDDYEVIQPLTQLQAPIATLEDKDLTDKKVVRYLGSMVKAGKISGIAKKFNMVRGDVLDAGSFTCFHWVDKCLNIAAQLNFEWMYMGQEYNDDVPLGEVVFYRLDDEQQTTDEPKNNMILDPKAVLPRFSSAVLGVFNTLIDS